MGKWVRKNGWDGQGWLCRRGNRNPKSILHPGKFTGYLRFGKKGSWILWEEMCAGERPWLRGCRGKGVRRRLSCLFLRMVSGPIDVAQLLPGVLNVGQAHNECTETQRAQLWHFASFHVPGSPVNTDGHLGSPGFAAGDPRRVINCRYTGLLLNPLAQFHTYVLSLQLQSVRRLAQPSLPMTLEDIQGTGPDLSISKMPTSSIHRQSSLPREGSALLTPLSCRPLVAQRS